MFNTFKAMNNLSREGMETHQELVSYIHSTDTKIRDIAYFGLAYIVALETVKTHKLTYLNPLTDEIKMEISKRYVNKYNELFIIDRDRLENNIISFIKFLTLSPEQRLISINGDGCICSVMGLDYVFSKEDLLNVKDNIEIFKKCLFLSRLI